MNSTDTPHIDAMTMQLARFEVPETPHARSYCRAPQSDRIMELEYALIAAKESEAVWKTERDKADQRRLEAEAEVEKLKKMVMEAARKGDELLEPYRLRAEKAETLLNQIQAFVEAINKTNK